MSHYRRIIFSGAACAGLLAVIQASASGIAVGAEHTAAELAQITARGRALYAYDTAAAAATDAVLKLPGCAPASHGAKTPWDLYIGQPAFNGWVFDFGSLSADRATFTVLCRAVQAGPGAPTFDATRPMTPADGPFDVQAARAVLLASGDFQVVQSPQSYNYAMLRRNDGEWYVYLYPGWSDVHDHPLGGDGRYLISADGNQILERHRIHDVGVPQDTDVFDVLIRRVPSYVSAQGHTYEIETDGSIEDLGEGAHPSPTPTT